MKRKVVIAAAAALGAGVLVGLAMQKQPRQPAVEEAPFLCADGLRATTQASCQ